jgi:dihydroorotate dehydrogenase
LLGERDAAIHGTGRKLPLVLKISPDLEAESLESLCSVSRRVGLDGIIATNTTIRREGIRSAIRAETGGMSGAPLHALSLKTVSALRQLLGPHFPIIGAGGIDSAAAARAMRNAGADLIQLYTGLIYRGPSLVSKCVRALNIM